MRPLAGEYFNGFGIGSRRGVSAAKWVEQPYQNFGDLGALPHRGHCPAVAEFNQVFYYYLRVATLMKFPIPSTSIEDLQPHSPGQLCADRRSIGVGRLAVQKQAQRRLCGICGTSDCFTP